MSNVFSMSCTKQQRMWDPINKDWDFIPLADAFLGYNRSEDECKELVNIQLKNQARRHDWTKTTEPYQTMFYNDLCLSKSTPNDVNMFDVLEMLCDCAVAGKARNENEIYYPTVSDEVLQKAFRNTFDILVNAIEVRD